VKIIACQSNVKGTLKKNLTTLCEYIYFNAFWIESIVLVPYGAHGPTNVGKTYNGFGVN
jgi:hypothetical protein